MDTLILILVLLVIIGGAVYAVYRSKKKGQKCIGCPYSGQCSSCCGNQKE